MNGDDAIRVALGLDIGGTKLALGLVDSAGQILSRSQMPTDSRRGLSDAVARVAAAVERMLAGGRSYQLAGLGIGCPGPLHPLTGIVNNPFTLPGWEGQNLPAAFGHALRLPARLENDADAALLGEAWAGAVQGVRDAAMLTFGTGVGGAVLTSGRLLRGAGYEHPELGHLPIDPHGPACYCGLRGCLESLASGTALGEAGRTIGAADAADVFARAARGDAAAEQIVARSVEACATAAAALGHAFLPSRIVLGGGVMTTQFDRYAPAMRARLAALTQFPNHRFEVVPARLGADAGLVGAASLILNEGPARLEVRS